MKHKRQPGFTIVELLIATAVFAVVITIGMYGFIQISRFYTKSLTIIRTQDTTRNLITDVSNQLQLTSGQYSTSTINGKSITCVGNKAYVYQLNVVEQGGGEAIASYDISSNACPTDFSGKQAIYLLRPGVRVLQFKINPYPTASGPLFNVTIGLLYAPKDNTTGPGTDLVQVDTSNPNDYTKWRCTATVRGSEYCSLSTMNTSVYKRVQGN